MPWWPHFLSCLRGLVRFVRDERESICNAFLKAGLAGTKALLFILRIPVFISWRWGSIWDVVRESKFAVNVFRTHCGVVLTVLATMTDGSLAAKVRETMYSDEWFRNFSFTYWFSENSAPCNHGAHRASATSRSSWTERPLIASIKAGSCR